MVGVHRDEAALPRGRVKQLAGRLVGGGEGESDGNGEKAFRIAAAKTPPRGRGSNWRGESRVTVSGLKIPTHEQASPSPSSSPSNPGPPVVGTSEHALRAIVERREQRRLRYSPDVKCQEEGDEASSQGTQKDSMNGVRGDPGASSSDVPVGKGRGEGQQGGGSGTCTVVLGLVLVVVVLLGAGIYIDTVRAHHKELALLRLEHAEALRQHQVSQVLDSRRELREVKELLDLAIEVPEYLVEGCAQVVRLG